MVKKGRIMKNCLAYWRRRLDVPLAVALLPVFVVVYALSFWLRFDRQFGPSEVQLFRATVAWVAVTQLAWFVGLRACRNWRRPVVFHDLWTLLQASTGSLLTLVAAHWLLLPQPSIPRGVLLIDWGATVILLGGARALARGFRETCWALSASADDVRVLIAGAGDMGASLLRMIRSCARLHYRVVGFVDAGAASSGTCVEGVPVLGAPENVGAIIQRHGIQQILTIQGELPGNRLREILDAARAESCDVRIIPHYHQLIEGTVSIQPRPVSIEDLLQREPVQLDIENIRRWIDGRVILVTGSAGSIGSEICRQLLRFSPRRIVLVDRNETGQFFLERELRALGADRQLELCIADILDEPRMRRLLMRYRPDVIFHAAAYKHVPLMESHPYEAVTNIVTATRRLADLAREHRVASFVMISTDKAVNPSSVMGACKRVAELYVQSLAGRSDARFVTVRFGNVIDSSGSVVQLFRQQIAAGGPVTVTHPDMRRYFMTIPEAAQLVIQAGAIGRGGQILLLDMGEPVRIMNLAADMIRLSGLRVGDDVAIEITGLRPGEKLYEELRIPGEKLLPTSHAKIIVAERKQPRVCDLLAAIDRLERIAAESPEDVGDLLREIVCGYQGDSGQPAVRQLAA
jgi:FlaA1/EpsC-like NDP-sugar epimerase